MTIGNFKIPNILVWLVLLGIPVIMLISTYSTFNNTEQDLRTTFEMETSNRTSFYDKMKHIISGKVQVTKAFDTSFQKVVQTAMDPRKDGAGILMKWVTESNPVASVGTLQELYKEVSRTIEAERNGFYERERTLASIKQQHSKFLRSFPNNFYNIFFNRQELKYTPIQSDYTRQVMETGTDNDDKVF